MAARLIRLTTRMLAAPLSFQPLPAALPSECTRLVQVSPPFPPCVAALHTSSLRHREDSLRKASPAPAPAGDFIAHLKTLTLVDDLVEVSKDKNLNSNSKILIISRISQLHSTCKDIKKKKNFLQLLENVNNQISSISNLDLLKLLRSLYVLQFNETDRYLESVKVEVQWRLRKLSIGTMGRLASIIPSPSMGDRLVQDLIKQVVLRWMEIRDYKTLFTLVSNLGFLSPVLMERLEDKILEFAETFTPDEHCAIISLLARRRTRSLSVLRALSFRLAEQKSNFTPSLCVELSFSYARLNFYQPQVLQKICSDIIPQLLEMKPLHIVYLTRSLATLRFSDQLFYEAIAQVTLEHKEFMANHVASILVSLGLLNYQPKQSEEFFNMIHQRLIPEFDSIQWFHQLDVVWVLCALNQVTTPYLQKVLVPEFYTQVLGDSPSLVTSTFLKLMHVNTAAQLECPWYQGPVLPDDLLLSMLKSTKDDYVSPRQTDLKNQLTTIFPVPGTMNNFVNTVYGWCLDAEVVINSDLQALELKNFVSPHVPGYGGTQPLPEGARRLAIMFRDFVHYVNPEKELLGRYVLNRRQLTTAGFIVVEVCYYDWQELKSDAEKQSFLKDRIRKVITEEFTQ